MDSRLSQAAQSGDANHFQQLLRENPLIFESLSLMSADNPFYIAFGTGNAEFVKEIIKLKPDIAKEANQDGFSPIHIAAANGHVEVVKELMKVDPNLCLLEGREKRTPLHYAAIKGRLEVISIMLSSCPGCIYALTVLQETALHLAVKTNQFEATKIMVDWVKETNKDDIFNMGDEQGNTVLHLAVWKKQRQMIELLLGRRRTGPDLLDVNAMNHNGLTALDVLLMFQSEAGDREILEIFQGAGAKRARDDIPYSQTFADTPTTPETDQSQRSSVEEYFKFQRGRDSPGTARNTLLVIAVLVATATFQFGVNPPGGVWQDTYITDGKNSTRDIQQHIAGEAILGTTNIVAYYLFVFFNTVGFQVSLVSINILTSRFPLQLELQICLIAMCFTYNTALINITPDSRRLYVILTTSILSSLTPTLFRCARHNMQKLRDLCRKYAF